MDIIAKLEALAAMPKDWRCVSIFSDGKVRTLDQPTKAQAESYANGQRRYLGKKIKTADGRTVTLDVVEVRYVGKAS